jgi:hypothetical protein
MTKNYGIDLEQQRKRLERLDLLECDSVQVRYLFLNLPGTASDRDTRIFDIGRLTQLPVNRIKDIVLGDPRFLETLHTRREIEIHNSRLSRDELDAKLEAARERKLR